MFLRIRSWARAFSFLLLVCATHHWPVKSQIDSTAGQMIGGFSFTFNNFIVLIYSVELKGRPGDIFNLLW
jgi:hypothetical protein